MINKYLQNNILFDKDFLFFEFSITSYKNNIIESLGAFPEVIGTGLQLMLLGHHEDCPHHHEW
jgi:hypothetical protein